MTITETALDTTMLLDEQTQRELQPPCDTLWRNSITRAVMRQCDQPAEWVQQAAPCPECKNLPPKRLRCQACFEHAARGGYSQCNRCGDRHPARLIFAERLR